MKKIEMVEQPKNIMLSVSDVSRHDYREWCAVDQLLKAIDTAADDCAQRIETNGDFEQFFITVGGQQIAFRLGGPQIDGLCQFIKWLADENMYDVDFKQNAVTDFEVDW